jgi:hypothetical protein
MRSNLKYSIVFLAVSLCFSSLIFGNEKNVKPVVPPKSKVVVEILYMNHGPLQAVLRQLRTDFAQFENKVEFRWYDFDNDLAFKKKKKIDYHAPMIIWIDDSNTFPINGKQVKFSGFPKGQGPEFARGAWEISDVISAINTTLGQK